MSAKSLIFASVAALIAIYFSPSLYTFLKTTPLKPTSALLTPADLKLYNGIDKPALYLSILGKVFDVSKGLDHYGPGKNYNFFIGRDSSRSFITGKFTDDAVDDKVADLSPEELRSLNHWLQFYKKEYKRVGKLVGRYYDENGKLTRYGREVRKLIKAAELLKESQDLEKLQYPPCNVEWDASRGTRVWCTNKSGGISREWVGFPRQLYEPETKTYRCACIRTSELAPNLKQYEDCDSESDTCYIKT